MQIEEILNELLVHYSTVEYIKEIRSGKEASVHLVKADEVFYALKIYKANQKYSTKNSYLPINEIGDSRSARAVKNKTPAGADIFKSIWTKREYKILRMMSDLTENVPKVFQYSNEYILMEFIGEDQIPAPRLNEVRLTPQEAEKCAQEVLNCVELFIQNDFVHGDLSAYNILWFMDKPIIIDFPQVLDISSNRNAFDKFKVDLNNIESHFEKYRFNWMQDRISLLYKAFHEKRIYG